MQYILRHSLLSLLFAIQHAGVLALSYSAPASATSSASWIFPVNDGTIINYIDTIVLQWDSNYATPFMQMWCQNGTIGNNVVQGSNFKVPASGSYNYVLSDDDPSQTSFPVACHAQLATAQNGAGLDDPVGVTFVSLTDANAKTFKLSASTTTSADSSSQITSTISSSSSTSAISSSTPSPSTSPTSTVPLNTSPPLPTSTGTTSTTSTGISTGAKAGIAIGAAVVVLGALVATIWLIRRKMAAARQSYQGTGVPELTGESRRFELVAPHGQHELDVKSDKKRSMYEMPA